MMRIFKKKKKLNSSTAKSDKKSKSQEILVDKSGATWVKNNKGLYRTGNKVEK